MAGFLLDTQIVAWSALTPERIKSAAQDILTSGAPLFVSSASIAELSIKLSIGKLKLPGTPIELCALLVRQGVAGLVGSRRTAGVAADVAP